MVEDCGAIYIGQAAANAFESLAKRFCPPSVLIYGDRGTLCSLVQEALHIRKRHVFFVPTPRLKSNIGINEHQLVGLGVQV